MTDAVSKRSQRFCQLSQTFGRPTERILRIPITMFIHQTIEILKNFRMEFFDTFPSPSFCPNSCVAAFFCFLFITLRMYFLDSGRNCITIHTSKLAYCTNSPSSE